MKLSLTLVDERPKSPHYASRETGSYNRVHVAEMQADRVVLAGLLRSVADSLDPRAEVAR